MNNAALMAIRPGLLNISTIKMGIYFFLQSTIQIRMAEPEGRMVLQICTTTIPFQSQILVLFRNETKLNKIQYYLITYKEWEHHYPSPEIPRKMALETAIFTFIFFLAL